MKNIFQKVMRYGLTIFFFLILFWVILLNPENIYSKKPQVDESWYLTISNNFSVEYIKNLYNTNAETKPITFLTVEKILHSDIFLTRVLNFILVIINTFLIYKLTRNKLSFIYPVIPIFLISMWLTAETIELMFLLLGLCYKERKGIYFGLAMIFRPYSILYSILLSKKQFIQMIVVGIIFSLVLLSLGLFFPYFYAMTTYTHTTYGDVDFLIFIMLIIFFIVGFNRNMLMYVLIASVPLYIRGFGHYFLPVYTFLFIGFLLSMNEDMKEVKINKVNLNTK